MDPRPVLLAIVHDHIALGSEVSIVLSPMAQVPSMFLMDEAGHVNAASRRSPPREGRQQRDLLFPCEWHVILHDATVHRDGVA